MRGGEGSHRGGREEYNGNIELRLDVRVAAWHNEQVVVCVHYHNGPGAASLKLLRLNLEGALTALHHHDCAAGIAGVAQRELARCSRLGHHQPQPPGREACAEGCRHDREGLRSSTG